MQRLLAFLFVVGICHAQIPSRHHTYTVTREHTLSASAGVVTIQQPASSSNTVEVRWVKLHSNIALTVELERDGTAATATAETEVGTNTNAPTQAAVAWYDSDVGNGTTIETIDMVGDVTYAIDLTAYRVYLIGDGTGVNFSVRTASGTGTVRITVCWREW